MIEPLLQLSDRDLQDLALALRSGRLAPPFSAVALRQVVSPEVAPRLAEALADVSAAAFGVEQIALTLGLLYADRLRHPRLDQVLELVTTGPGVDGSIGRDTSVVVRQLFANAGETVLAAGYAVHQG